MAKNKKKFSFFGGKPEEKKEYEVKKGQVKEDKRLEKTSNKVEISLRPVNEQEQIDLVTGLIYRNDQNPRVKEKGQIWSPNLFKNKELTAKPIIKKNVISSKLLIVCIEISYPLEKIEKLLKAVFVEKETFIKFIFFSNGIYKTDVLFFSKISEEEILKLIKAQKDLTSDEEIFKTLKEEYLHTLRRNFNEQPEELNKNLLNEENLRQKVKERKLQLNSSNILLYDAVDEAFQISKEDLFFPKRKYVIENDEYVIEENKYIFIFSGEEKGSLLKKNELQSILKDLRAKEANLNVILTNPKNLLDISTLGFRWIRTINII